MDFCRKHPHMTGTQLKQDAIAMCELLQHLRDKQECNAMLSALQRS